MDWWCGVFTRAVHALCAVCVHLRVLCAVLRLLCRLRFGVSVRAASVHMHASRRRSSTRVPGHGRCGGWTVGLHARAQNECAAGCGCDSPALSVVRAASVHTYLLRRVSAFIGAGACPCVMNDIGAWVSESVLWCWVCAAADRNVQRGGICNGKQLKHVKTAQTSRATDQSALV